MLIGRNSGGNALENVIMSKVAELLERKRHLLARIQEQPGPEQLAEIERSLKDIDQRLNEIESEELDEAPIAPR